MKLRTRPFLFACLLACTLAFGPTSAWAQYGLRFAGQEVVSDQRTGLDLSAGKKLCLRESIELSFDLSFIPNHSDYFGYVVRLIGDGNKNIDLLYDRSDQAERHFRIVAGGKFSEIAFDIDSIRLFNEWNPLKIKLDVAANSLEVRCGDEVYTERLPLNGMECLRVLFGQNDYLDFKTTDVPAMRIRDVRIRQGERLMHHWPLDEDHGGSIKDVAKGMDGVAHNPHWIRRLHYEWELLQERKVGGQASVAYDAKRHVIYVVGKDSLLALEVATGLNEVYTYANGPLQLVNGSQSYFDTVRNRLVNISIDQRIVSQFDFGTLRWSHGFVYPAEGTNYLHFNKFQDWRDSSLYFVGGYGHFRFKNEINRYAPDGTWHRITLQGDSLTPRYLAGLGAVQNGAYLLGGYGSLSGQQMLNPKHLYDLLFFDAKANTIVKKYEFDPGIDDFVWANSLVVDEAQGRYFGLVFPKHKYHATLRLVSGSLENPGLVKLGGEIPYLFHDIRSFADLFYDADAQRFLAVTLYHDESDITTAKIHSLYGPVIPTAAKELSSGFHGSIYYAVGTVLLVLAVIFFMVGRKRRRRMPETAGDRPVRSAVQPRDGAADAVKEELPVAKKSIFLFGGDLQLFDAEGADITRSFTPLIKELFLVVLLHTIRWGRGISSEKLIEQFWFDKSTESARNNRSVNIAKINTVLERLGGAKISKETGYWKFQGDADTYIDYKNYLAIVTSKDKLDKKRIQELSAIVQRKGFLSETDYEWLDSFKAEVSIQVINTYMRFAEHLQIAQDPEFMVELANYIFYFDPVHEEAMAIKCKALAHMGNHSLATQTFENFCQEYRHIYGEEFGKDYKTVLA